MKNKIIEVVAAVLRRDGDVFICSRPRNSALAGFWEFPGGKVEPGETPRNALIREIREELNAEIVPERCFWRLEHDYGDKYVRVTFYSCVPSGEFCPEPRDNQEMKWVPAEKLDLENFLPADLPLAQTIAFLEKKRLSGQ